MAKKHPNSDERMSDRGNKTAASTDTPSVCATVGCPMNRNHGGLCRTPSGRAISPYDTV